MKVWVKALFLSVLSLTANAANVGGGIELSGELKQGAILFGKAPVGSKVFFNDTELVLSPDGRFVFGVGRDAAPSHTLEVVTASKRTQLPVTITPREYDVQHVNGVAQKYVSPPAEVSARIARDAVEVRKARETSSTLNAVFTTPLMPAKGRISGVYGSQRIFNGEPRNPHYGLDVAAPTGTQVIAPLAGKVTLAQDLYYSGLTLIVDHGYGISSTFMHLSQIDVSVGDTVQQGDKIGEIGATGRVTGAHLDWRINWFHERLDPALLPGLNLPQ